MIRWLWILAPVKMFPPARKHFLKCIVHLALKVVVKFWVTQPVLQISKVVLHIRRHGHLALLIDAVRRAMIPLKVPPVRYGRLLREGVLLRTHLVYFRVVLQMLVHSRLQLTGKKQARSVLLFITVYYLGVDIV